MKMLLQLLIVTTEKMKKKKINTIPERTKLKLNQHRNQQRRRVESDIADKRR